MLFKGGKKGVEDEDRDNDSPTGGQATHEVNYVSEGEGQAGDFAAIDPHSGVKRGLKTRHLCMIIEL